MVVVPVLPLGVHGDHLVAAGSADGAGGAALGLQPRYLPQPPYCHRGCPPGTTFAPRGGDVVVVITPSLGGGDQSSGSKTRVPLGGSSGEPLWSEDGGREEGGGSGVAGGGINGRPYVVEGPSTPLGPGV